MDVRDPKALKRQTKNGRGAEGPEDSGAKRRRHEDPLVVKLEALAADLPPEGVTLHPNLTIMYAAIWADNIHAMNSPLSWQANVKGRDRSPGRVRPR